MSDVEKQPLFNAFNRYGAVRVYHRNLPHWRQAGATYFVTFRLGDSIPKDIMMRWLEEDVLWLSAHGVARSSGQCTGGIQNGAELHATELPNHLQREWARRTARRMHVELDHSHGCCLFRDLGARQVLQAAFKHFHGTRWWLGDYVIMPNHVHLLAQPCSNINGAEHRSPELEDILGSVKGFVSTRLTKLGFKQGRLWQQENYDRLVRDSEELAIWRKYIRQNPEKAHLDSGEFTTFECDWL